MNDPHESPRPTVYHYWSHAAAETLTWPWKLFEMQHQVGCKIAESALRIPGEPVAADEPSAATSSLNDLPRLEALAFEQARQGHALPKEIYQAPYRDRVDWTRFPDWARPVDPELFEQCGHEG